MNKAAQTYSNPIQLPSLLKKKYIKKETQVSQRNKQYVNSWKVNHPLTTSIKQKHLKVYSNENGKPR